MTGKIGFVRRADGHLAGVSVSLPGGQWFLEADDPARDRRPLHSGEKPLLDKGFLP